MSKTPKQSLKSCQAIAVLVFWGWTLCGVQQYLLLFPKGDKIVAARQPRAFLELIAGYVFFRAVDTELCGPVTWKCWGVVLLWGQVLPTEQVVTLQKINRV